MTNSKDIFRAAQLVINQHGANAERFAEEKMKYFMKIEDIAGASTWLIIAQAIEQLRKDFPSGAIH